VFTRVSERLVKPVQGSERPVGAVAHGPNLYHDNMFIWMRQGKADTDTTPTARRSPDMNSRLRCVIKPGMFCALLAHRELSVVSCGVELMLEEGASLFVTSEMGIGNTTVNSALTAVLTGRSMVDVIGWGASIGSGALRYKAKATVTAIALNRPDPGDP
jgi:hypothetical protein